MDALNSLGDIVRALLIVIGALTVLLVLLVVVMLKMHRDNPLKRTLRLLTYRVAATALAGLFAIPIEPIPIADVAYDVGVPILLIWYWLTFFRNLGHVWSEPSPPQSPLPDQETSREEAKRLPFLGRSPRR